MRKLVWLAASLILISGLANSSPARALSLLDFSTVVPNAGVLSYATPGGSLIGHSIGIASVSAIIAPVLAGTTLACVDCTLSFETGALASQADGSWIFNGIGSQIDLVGKIPAIGIASLTSLVDARFTDQVRVIRFPNSFSVVFGNNQGSVNPVLSSHFGESGIAMEDGGISLSFAAPNVAPDKTFTSTMVYSGTFTATIPEPKTAFFFGLGLAGLALAKRSGFLLGDLPSPHMKG